MEHDVTQVQNTGDSSEDSILLLGRDVHDVHGFFGVLKVVGVVDSVDIVTSTAVQVVIGVRRPKEHALYKRKLGEAN